MLKTKYIFNSEKPEIIKIDSELKIIKVTTLDQFKDFFRLPWKIYENDKNWVPPIWEETKGLFKTKNYFWRHAKACLFLAYKNNEIVGRIAAIIDDLCRSHDTLRHDNVTNQESQAPYFQYVNKLY